MAKSVLWLRQIRGTAGGVANVWSNEVRVVGREEGEKEAIDIPQVGVVTSKAGKRWCRKTVSQASLHTGSGSWS